MTNKTLKSKKQFALGSIIFIVYGLSSAQNIPTGKAFDFTVAVGSIYQPAVDTIIGGIQSPTVGFETVSNLFDNATASGFSKLNGAYNNNSAAVIRLGYRGLPLTLTTIAGSQAVIFTVPALNQTKIFDSKPTRNENISDLRQYLKSDGGNVLNQINQQLAKSSPIDPVAGNPNSLQSQMVMGDFDRNFTQSATNIRESTSGQTSNLIGVGASFGSFQQGGLTSQSATLPLSYTFRSDLDPRRQLTIYAPISVNTVSGARSYAANLGVSYRIPINDEWALTPGFGYGISGSVDLGSAASMLAATVTSQYTLRMDGFDLAFGNTLGMYQSQRLNLGGYSIDPRIKNSVLRSGVLVSIPARVFDQKMSYEFSLINTLYAGTALYSQQYNEIGFTLGTNKSADSSRGYLRAGGTYLQGQNGIKGFKLNIGYWF